MKPFLKIFKKDKISNNNIKSYQQQKKIIQVIVKSKSQNQNQNQDKKYKNIKQPSSNNLKQHVINLHNNSNSNNNSNFQSVNNHVIYKKMPAPVYIKNMKQNERDQQSLKNIQNNKNIIFKNNPNHINDHSQVENYMQDHSQVQNFVIQKSPQKIQLQNSQVKEYKRQDDDKNEQNKLHDQSDKHQKQQKIFHQRKGQVVKFKSKKPQSQASISVHSQDQNIVLKSEKSQHQKQQIKIEPSQSQLEISNLQYSQSQNKHTTMKRSFKPQQQLKKSKWNPLWKAQNQVDNSFTIQLFAFDYRKPFEF